MAVPGGSQQVWCAGEGPAVVLVNGIGDDATSTQWVEVERDLSERARVCRYDRPGTGGSLPPAVAGRAAAALDAELDAVVAHAAGPSRVVLVAHSFGGYLARIYADRHPERIAAVVLVDALDPSVGVQRGTGADDLASVAMADEGLDLQDVEAAAAAVGHLPGDPPLVVLSRGEEVTPQWSEGQDRLAALSVRAQREVVGGAGHQLPSEAPDAVVAAVDRVLRAAG